MTFHLPLAQMNLSEKLHAMEMLWDDLQHHHEDVHSPEWHRELLQSREDQVRQGDMVFEDWPEVKSSLLNDLKCNYRTPTKQ